MRSKIAPIIIPILIGIAAFLVVYGITPLDVTNDRWIIAGYDEYDIVQHYLGWVGFRQSDWAFPLGFTPNIDVANGTIISFTDSIPWLAIIFKLFRGILPKTFQYLGLYALLCYILQSIAAFRIIHFKTKNITYSALGTLLFSFAPIMLERMMRHTALASHWFILFSILIWMKNREKYSVRNYVYYLILMLLSIGIHPYFLPMIAGFMTLSFIEDIHRKRYITGAFFIGNPLLTYIAGRIIGVVGGDVGASRDGFGYYSMNINAPINPTSIGGYDWSSFMKIHPQTLGNYDGFNYLGAGIVIGIIITVILSLIFFDKKTISSYLKERILFILLLVCFTLFAISNVPTLNGRELFEVPLPSKILYLCGIFRASSRLFYPVYYCIYLFVILILYKLKDHLQTKYIYGIIIFIVLIQLYDLHICLIEKHAKMRENADFVSILDDKGVYDVLENNTNILIDRYSGNKLIVGVAGLNHNDMLCYFIANSGDYSKSMEYSNEILDRIKQTGNIESYVIVTTDMNCLSEFLEHENIGYYEIYGNYFICDVNSSEYVRHPKSAKSSKEYIGDHRKNSRSSQI